MYGIAFDLAGPVAWMFHRNGNNSYIVSQRWYTGLKCFEVSNIAKNWQSLKNRLRSMKVNDFPWVDPAEARDSVPTKAGGEASRLETSEMTISLHKMAPTAASQGPFPM